MVYKVEIKQLADKPETLATSQAVGQQPHSFMHWQFGMYMPMLGLKACVL